MWDMRMSLPPCSITYWIDGRAPTMRVSSLILPSFTGTLKSTRMRTRLPWTSTSRRVLVFMVRWLGGSVVGWFVVERWARSLAQNARGVKGRYFEGWDGGAMTVPL